MTGPPVGGGGGGHQRALAWKPALPEPSLPSLAPRALSLPGAEPGPWLSAESCSRPPTASRGQWGRGTHQWGSPARGSQRGCPPEGKHSAYLAFRLSAEPSMASQGTDDPGRRDRGRVSEGSHLSQGATASLGRELLWSPAQLWDGAAHLSGPSSCCCDVSSPHKSPVPRKQAPG